MKKKPTDWTDDIWTEIEFLEDKKNKRETVEFLENLLQPENNGELDELIEELEKHFGAKGRPFWVGKNRSARVKFVEAHIKQLLKDLE